MLPRILALLTVVGSCIGLGFTVPPVKVGDTQKYSTHKNPINCITYETVKDDIIMVRVKAGDRLPLQLLNLRVFDDVGNRLRFHSGVEHELSFMFTNLNEGTHSRHLKKASEPESQDTDTLLIHICFDNIYTDKSWSFNPREYDVELFVDIKTLSSIAETNYDKFIHYFKALQEQQDGGKTTQHITQEEFDAQIDYLKVELNSVVDSLTLSEETLNALLEQEVMLRDVNEEIFSKYTSTTIILLSCILVFGLVQLIFFRCYLKKTKLL